MKILTNIPAILALCSILTATIAQNQPILTDPTVQHFIERATILSGGNTVFNTADRFADRKSVAKFLVKYDDGNHDEFTPLDENDMRQWALENNDWCNEEGSTFKDIMNWLDAQRSPRYIKREKPLLKYFYKTPAHFFEHNAEHWYIRANPIFCLQGGSSDYYYNERGVSLRGGVDNRVYFTFNLQETQAVFPGYVDSIAAHTQAIPGFGLFKEYNSGLIKSLKGGYDVFHGDGSVGVRITKHIGSTLGYGRHFIGEGIRSLILSDHPYNFLYLQLNTQLGRLTYKNLYGELGAQSPNQAGNALPGKKYLALHHLGLRLWENWNVGITESVVFSRLDHFEFHYLLPVIFYRTIEHALGSADNVLLAFDASGILNKRVQIYGQFVLDELIIKEFLHPSRGWWGNKYAIQGGVKYINAFGLDHLDLQLEYNRVRPYMYQHGTPAASYQHNNQPLAHPLGANFQELIGTIYYQPLPRLSLRTTFMFAKQGENVEGINYGSDIMESVNTRPSDYQIHFLQGSVKQIALIHALASYRLFPGCFVDAQMQTRTKNTIATNFQLKDSYFALGIRLNSIPWRGIY